MCICRRQQSDTLPYPVCSLLCLPFFYLIHWIGPDWIPYVNWIMMNTSYFSCLPYPIRRSNLICCWTLYFFSSPSRPHLLFSPKFLVFLYIILIPQPPLLPFSPQFFLLSCASLNSCHISSSTTIYVTPLHPPCRYN